MLKIWGRNNSVNVQKVMWTVGELGLEHERIDVGGAYGGTDTPEYGAMNPNRIIPTVQDNGTVVWESNAIVRYLAAQYGAGSLWPEDPGARAALDQWMDWQQTTLQPAITPVFWGLVRTPPEQRDQASIDAGAEKLAELWPIADAHLAGRSFVAGDSLTMGDIPIGALCYRYYSLDIKRPVLPNVEAWYQRLQARAPYREHVMISLA